MRTTRAGAMTEVRSSSESGASELPQEATSSESTKTGDGMIQKILEEALLASGLASLTVKNDIDDNARVGEGSAANAEAGGDNEDQGAAAKTKAASNIPKPHWMDITEVFTGAAGLLRPGELVQEAHFSLFDAMSAIELMDIKMDATLQWGTFSRFPKSFDDAVAGGYLKLCGQTPSEVVGVVDEVFACLATWLEGHTLAQTVFTCLYLLGTSKVENLYIRAFSQAIIKIAEFMRSCICQGRVFAEEDQQGVRFGFEMLDGISDTTVSAVLKEVEDKMLHLVKHATKNETDGSPQKGAINAQNDLTPLFDFSDAASLKALIVRLKFVKNLFGFVVSINKGTSQGIENALQKLSLCCSLIDEIRKTAELGKRLDPSNPLELGFHPVINQHLLPPSYKPYAIIPRDRGLEVLQTILEQVQRVLALGKINSFVDLFKAIVEFCSDKESPNILARSMLVTHCLQGDRKKLFGGQTIEMLLREDVRLMSNPPSLNLRSPLSTSPQGKENADRFFQHAVAPMMEYLRVFCQHRARLRQRIVRYMDQLSEFQQETERIDHLLNDLSMNIDPQRQHLACFGTWLLYYMLIMMTEYVVLGFEYNLYSPFEMHYVYWYLEYLYGWNHITLKSAGKLLMQEPPASGGKGKRKVKKKRELPKEKEREAAIIHAKRLMCIGIMRGLEALLLDEKIPQPTFEHGGRLICFHHRFLPFSVLGTPSMLTYEDYERLAGLHNYKGRDLNLYEASAKHFIAARTAVESIPHLDEDLEGLLKVVKTNIVIMNLASKGHKKESKLSPVFDFSVHQHFPVIRIN